jgi:hypothetical protein
LLIGRRIALEAEVSFPPPTETTAWPFNINKTLKRSLVMKHDS